MREIYSWTDWFSELAEKIAKGGEEFLIDRVKQIEWKVDGTEPPSWLTYGDEKIDPLSFFYYLVQRSQKPAHRSRIYPSFNLTFDMKKGLPVELEGADYTLVFPAPLENADVQLHYGTQADPELLWNLFRDAVQGLDSVNPEDFDGALQIDRVGGTKLTQALFLINSSQFVPFDDKMKAFGDFPKKNFNWVQYKEWIQRVRTTFPGCEPYEINLLANLWKNGGLPVPDKYFQVSTNADGPKAGDFWKDLDPKRDFEPNNWVLTGGPKSGVSWEGYASKDGDLGYPVDHPSAGDVVLVRTGRLQGRGIGIVYKNDYLNRLSQVSRIHVVWINRKDAQLSGMTPIEGFTYAQSGTRDAFRNTPTYKPTFDLLDRIGKHMSNQIPRTKHPLNQILYGPPGTGKTYHTINHALAILKDVSVADVERDTGKFQKRRFDPKNCTGQIAFVTFHQNFAYEDFIEGIRPKLDDEDEGNGQIRYELRNGIFKQIAEAAEEETNKPFVLIIDEINRGNIAKIFGELITLIEDSRRLDSDDETKVTLPYSQKSFGVPKNLYLIGTMNTADRSIQLLDAALRRRFDFVEMMPRPDLLNRKVEGVVDLQLMLQEMNNRITALFDREHQIGHTYLLGVNTIKELSVVFQNKIFPLLQEYFFQDWSKIRFVLNENGFVIGQKVLNLPPELEPTNEDRVIFDRLPQHSPEWKDPKEYQKIYQADKAGDN